MIAVAIWMISNTPKPAPVVVQPEAEAVVSAPEVFPPGTAVAMPAPELPPEVAEYKPRVVVSPEALREMDDVQFMLRDYRARLGEGNPTGTNAEIMKEVMGGNRVRARLGPPEGQKLNEQGELVDRWGAPYFFHSISMNEMELRSSGPDQTMWTTDDIIVK